MEHPSVNKSMETSYDFDYNANIFPSHRDMFLCMRDIMKKDINNEGIPYNYGYLANTGESILMESFYEVHIREIKRFIRSGTLTRDDAVRSLIQVVYEGTRYAGRFMFLIEKMLDYLISDDTLKKKKPVVPYDLLFNTYFNGTNVTLEQEVVDGGYHIRGPLIDIFALHYVNFDVSPYADWKNVNSNVGYPNPYKHCYDPERFEFIKARSKYLCSF